MAQNNEKETKKKISGLILAVVAGIIVLVAGMGIGITVFGSPAEESFLTRFTSNTEVEASEVSIPLDEFIVNVYGETARSQALVRMELTLTSYDDQAKEIVDEEIAKIRDAVIHVTASLSVESILEEEEGEFVIKDMIKDRINRSLEQDLIEDVYVTNILIQR